MSEPTDVSILRALVEEGTEEIAERWKEAVKRDVETPSSEGLSEPLLLDSVPEVLREVLRVLEEPDAAVERAHIYNAEKHGRLRARQEFEVRELVREYQILRDELFSYLDEHRDRLRSVDQDGVFEFLRRVGKALDEALRETIDAFVEEQTGRLRQQARTDSLTGLLNHRTFYERLGEEVERASRYGTIVTVALIDLDHFKAVNETRGHRYGDRLLVRCATALEERLRASDIVSRYGGDEFAVILPQTHERHALDRLDKLVDELAEELRDADVPPSFGLSFGIASFPQHGQDAGALVEHADQRLRLIKKSR